MTNFIMSKEYIINDDYKPADSVFEIPYEDISSTLIGMKSIYVANAAVIMNASADDTAKKLTLMPGPYVSGPRNTFSTTIRYEGTFQDVEDEDPVSRVAYSKLTILTEKNGEISKATLTAEHNKLSPDDYLSFRSTRDGGKNDLDSIVTKKGLITNLKEFAKQINAKIGSASVFSINYNLNGGHWADGYEPRTTFDISTDYKPLPPRKVGYTFAGWNVYPAESADRVDIKSVMAYTTDANDVAVKPAQTCNLTAFAKWDSVKYRVTFLDKDNQPIFKPLVTYGNDATSSNVNIVNDDSTVTYTSPDAESGYKFDNKYTLKDKNNQIIYYENGTSLDTIYDLVKSDNEPDETGITLTPVFVPKIYEITYDLHEGGTLESSNGVDHYTYGTSFVLPTPYRPGYKFDGWNIGTLRNQKVISPTDFKNNAKSNAIEFADSLTATPTWSKNTYHFEFDVQGGVLSNTDNIYIVPNETYIVTNPTRVGYTFAGWDGDTKEVTIGKPSNGETTIKTKDTIDTDISLRATWTPNEVTVKLEIWVESVDSPRDVDTTATLENTIYNVNNVQIIKATDNKKPITGSQLTVSSSTNSISITFDDNTGNTKIYTYNINAGFSKVSVVKSDETAKADGTTIIRVYLSRKTAYYRVNDFYDTGNSKTDTRVNNYRTTTSCLYGTLITEAALSTLDGRTPDKPTISTTVVSTNSSSPTEIKFTYSRKKFTVKFDLNGLGTYIGGPTGDLKTIEALYNEEIDLPTITEDNKIVKTSSWYNGSNDVGTGKYTVKSDVSFIRRAEYEIYTINICTNGPTYWKYGTLSLSTSSPTAVTVAYNKFPYFLKNASCTGADSNYVFDRWQISTDNINYTDLGGTIISKEYLDTLTTKGFYVKAVFKEAEPKIKTISFKDTLNSKLRFTIVTATTNTDCYITQLVSNTSTIGTKMEKGSNNIYATTETMNIITTNGQNKVLITPVQEKDGTRICGKPIVGTYVRNSGNTPIWSFESVYSVSNTDTNTQYTTDGGLISEAEREKLSLLSNGATKTAAINGSVSPNSPNAYVVGTIKVDDAIIDLYGKDTTYQKAQNNSLGLVMPGTNNIASGTLDPDNDWYPVAVDSAGHMYVNVQARQKGNRVLGGQIKLGSITPGTGDNAGFASIRIDFPTNVYSTKLIYAPYVAGSTLEAKCKIGHRNFNNMNTSLSLNIPGSEKAIRTDNSTSYIYATCVTNQGVYDFVLRINIYGKNAPFVIDLI